MNLNFTNEKIAEARTRSAMAEMVDIDSFLSALDDIETLKNQVAMFSIEAVGMRVRFDALTAETNRLEDTITRIRGTKRPDIEELRIKIKKAHDKLSAMCLGERFRMTIPVQPDDTDIVIGNGLSAGEKACDQLTKADSLLETCAVDRDDIHAQEDYEIKAICERLGYGAVMDSAARLWRRKDPIGAFTVGPCRVLIEQYFEEKKP